MSAQGTAKLWDWSCSKLGCVICQAAGRGKGGGESYIDVLPTDEAHWVGVTRMGGAEASDIIH